MCLRFSFGFTGITAVLGQLPHNLNRNPNPNPKPNRGQFSLRAIARTAFAAGQPI